MISVLKSRRLSLAYSRVAHVDGTRETRPQRKSAGGRGQRGVAIAAIQIAKWREAMCWP